MPRPIPGLAIEAHIPETPWASRGACVGASPGLFFSEGDEDIAYAKSICNRCTVRALCLEQALAQNEKEGVWGGLTGAQRRTIRRHRARPVA